MKSTMKALVRGLKASGLIGLTMSSALAMAQTQETAPTSAPEAAAVPASGVEDIVVTAQRRSENLQDTPIAITALTSNALRASGITDLTGVVRASPSLYFAPRSDE